MQAGTENLRGKFPKQPSVSRACTSSILNTTVESSGMVTKEENHLSSNVNTIFYKLSSGFLGFL